MKNSVGVVLRTAATCLTFFLSGCAIFPKPSKSVDFAAIEAQTTQAAPAAATPAEDAAPIAKPAAEPEDRLLYRRDTKGSTAEQKRKPDRFAGRTVTLSFVNAPAAEVARVVVSEVLGAPLAVANPTPARLTLSAPEPIPADEALTLLEEALAESGLALMRGASGYVLTTLTDAQKQAQSPRGGTGGYGVVYAPVRYGLPSEVASLIQPFVSERLTVTADDARGVLILKGPDSDVETAKEAIATFDSAQLADRTFGMFRLQYTDPMSLRDELNSILQETIAGKGKAAELIPIPRLNLLFVTTRSKQAFDDVASWINRLDQPSGGDRPRLHYYVAQNTPAAALANQVSAAFGGASGGAGASLNSPAPLTASGASAVDQTFRAQEAPPPASFEAGGASITTDELNNALIIRSTDHQYGDILQLIRRMDVLAPQVLIEATIAEVTLNHNLAFGIRWSYDNAESTATLSDNAAGALAPVFPGLTYSYIANSVRASLNTLAAITDVNVLSSPSIMVLNNQTANLQVGDQVPIVTQQATSVQGAGSPIVSTLQLRDTGVILTVKPRINASDVVVLEISQEVSDVTPTTTSGIDSPTIQQRKFTSTVAVKNNGTVALGGLIRETHTDTVTGVPVLKDLPLLGYAFKSRNVQKRRTELIVFLTPRIIRTDDDARSVIHELRRDMYRLGAEKR